MVVIIRQMLDDGCLPDIPITWPSETFRRKKTSHVFAEKEVLTERKCYEGRINHNKLMWSWSQCCCSSRWIGSHSHAPELPRSSSCFPHGDWGRLAQVADERNLVHLAGSVLVAFPWKLCSAFLTLAPFLSDRHSTPIWLSRWLCVCVRARVRLCVRGSGRVKPPNGSLCDPLLIQIKR